jgi:hypothetical protein
VVGSHLGWSDTTPTPVQDQIIWQFRTPAGAARRGGRRRAQPGRRLPAGAGTQPARRPVRARRVVGRCVRRGARVDRRMDRDRRARDQRRRVPERAAHLAARVRAGPTPRAGGPTRLVLAGVAISYLATAGTSFLQLYTNPLELRGIMFWMLGSLANARWDDLGIPTAVMLVAMVWLLGRSRTLDVMSAGDDAASALGVAVNRFRIELLVVSSLLTATAVAVSGGIGFVGLMVPHAARFVVGPGHRRMLPVAMLGGAWFMVLVDLASRIADRPERVAGRHLHGRVRRAVLPGAAATLGQERSVKLSVAHLGVVIDDRSIVDDVSIELRPGTFHGLVGPNGSGKSTLLRCVYRALRPSTGAVFLGDDDLWRRLDAREAARRRAVVTQDHPLDLDHSVRDVVLMGRAPHKRMFERDDRRDTEIAERALDTVGMTLGGGSRGHHALRWRAATGDARPGARAGGTGAGARRADQPPRHPGPARAARDGARPRAHHHRRAARPRPGRVALRRDQHAPRGQDRGERTARRGAHRRPPPRRVRRAGPPRPTSAHRPAAHRRRPARTDRPRFDPSLDPQENHRS